jgi:serine/threonine protein kinase
MGAICGNTLSVCLPCNPRADARRAAHARREGKAKIADVGLAQMVQTTHISNLNGMGTFAYAAPELLTGSKCNEAADIFSFGVLLWELVSGEIPRRGKLRELRCARAHSRPDLAPPRSPSNHCTLHALPVLNMLASWRVDFSVCMS